MDFSDFLKTKRYPGRFIAVGKDGDSFVAVYGATGRSPSSLARRFVQKGDGIFMGAVDDTVSREGNAELLEYPAVQFLSNGIVVANGRHIGNITALENREARRQLSYALSEEAYEPDEYKTPRITGCLVKTSRGMEAALHIARYASDGIDRSCWNIELAEGEGKFISTYGGDDVVPTPSFSGDPVSVTLTFGSADTAAKALFKALSPKFGEADYRIGIIAVYFSENGEQEVAIVNKR